jgi:hypothetical protein
LEARQVLECFQERVLDDIVDLRTGNAERSCDREGLLLISEDKGPERFAMVGERLIYQLGIGLRGEHLSCHVGISTSQDPEYAVS